MKNKFSHSGSCFLVGVQPAVGEILKVCDHNTFCQRDIEYNGKRSIECVNTAQWTEALHFVVELFEPERMMHRATDISDIAEGEFRLNVGHTTTLPIRVLTAQMEADGNQS